MRCSVVPYEGGYLNTCAYNGQGDTLIRALITIRGVVLLTLLL